MTLRTDALDYDLPPERIATSPAEPRDSARLMVVPRAGGPFRHAVFRDLPDLLAPGDLLVMNDSRVLPARIGGRRQPGGGRWQGLFLSASSPSEWQILVRANSPMREGAVLDLVGSDGESPYTLTLRAPAPEGWHAQLDPPGDAEAVLARIGRPPLPPYILHARRDRDEPVYVDADDAWYQTVFAGRESGSIAAPTAGLHMSERVLHALEARGVRTATVTLHVGSGTFKPVAAETLDTHPMHEERWSVSASALAALRETRAAGGRVIAIGTTSVRTLESIPEDALRMADATISGATSLMIAPGYSFRVVDGLVTNFHLPRSTLLALVGAMGGLERILAAYKEAIEQGYRFYSYGDAMLIV